MGYNTAQFHHGNRKDDTLISNCVAVGLLAPWGTNTRQGGQAFKPFAKYCIVFALRNKVNQVTGFYFRSTENNTDQKHYYLKDSTGLYPAYPKQKKKFFDKKVVQAIFSIEKKKVQVHTVMGLMGKRMTMRLRELREANRIME